MAGVPRGALPDISAPTPTPRPKSPTPSPHSKAPDVDAANPARVEPEAPASRNTELPNGRDPDVSSPNRSVETQPQLPNRPLEAESPASTGPDVENTNGRIPEAEVEPGVRAKQPTADGAHQIKVTESGQVVRCSKCEPLRTRYEHMLDEGDFRTRMDRIDEIAQDPKRATEADEMAVQLDAELQRLEIQRYDDLTNRGLNLSQTELEQLQAIRQARGGNLEDVLPLTPEHKAQRWANYTNRKGDWSYERWSQQYPISIRNAKVGLAQEQIYRDLLGGENRVIQSSRGPRQVDIYLEAKREMYQIKTGKEDLTTVRHGGQLPNQEAIARDAEFVQRGFKVYWILEKGGSKQLLEALGNAGIEVKGAEFLEELQRLAQGG
jgi:hypothetical protein